MWNRFKEAILHWWHMWQARRWSKKLIAVRADQVELALRKKEPDEVWMGLKAHEMTAMSAISFHQNKAALIRRNRGEP